MDEHFSSSLKDCGWINKEEGPADYSSTIDKYLAKSK